MSSTTRRNGGTGSATPKKRDLSDEQTAVESTPTKPPKSFIPPPGLLTLYPSILALGSFYSILPSTVPPPSGPAEALAPGLASDINTPSMPQSAAYFASKNTLFNLYFVKINWFWTTLAFTLLLVSTFVNPKTKTKSNGSRWLQTLLRYTIATATWIATTQWFFGPPFIDRSFISTGGKCEVLPFERNADIKQHVENIFTSVACKASGGRWRGGHDISGHVFLLVLSSAFLILEMMISNRQSSHPSISPQAAAAMAHDLSPEEKRAVGGWESDAQAKMTLWTRYFVYAVIALDIWMLLMTAVFFHTWLEKLSGLLISSSCIWIVYYLPVLLPAWRTIIGPE